MNGLVPDDRQKARQLDAKAYLYDIENGILYHFYSTRSRYLPKDQSGVIKQLAIPKVLRKEVLDAYHDNMVGCHQGQERTYEVIRQKYYWPNLYTVISTYIKSWIVCQQSRRNTHSHHVPLQPMPIGNTMTELNCVPTSI